MTVFSLSSGCLFLANKKAASTTIQSILSAQADVVFYRPRKGKHLSHGEATQKMAQWGVQNPEQCFSFGVIRDPASWVRSWYNFRLRQGIKNPNHPSHARSIPEGCTFDEFVEEVVAPKPLGFGRIGTQSQHFRGTGGDIAVNYLARVEHISDDIQPLLANPALAQLTLLATTRANVSVSQPNADNEAIDRARDRITAHFAEDARLYDAANSGALRQIPDQFPLLEKGNLKIDDDSLREDLASRINIAVQGSELEKAADLARDLSDDDIEALELQAPIRRLRRRGHLPSRP